METTAFADARSLMLMSCFLAGSVFFPEASESLSRAVVRTGERLRARLRELVRATGAARREPFWQIDMTKFEP